MYRSIVAGSVVAVAALVAFVAPAVVRAEGLDADLQKKVDAKVEQIKGWASDATLVAACRAQNAGESGEVAEMTQDKWAKLTVIDPFVRSFTKNAAGAFLKSKKDDLITEAFASSESGKKVAFLSKPTNWSHKGKPKHDKPIAGNTWQGSIEVDESTGSQQLQVAVPVKDGDQVVGSLVVGLNVSKLKGGE
jgi:hypothetical protein